jgi:hypothetical protein
MGDFFSFAKAAQLRTEAIEKLSGVDRVAARWLAAFQLLWPSSKNPG